MMIDRALELAGVAGVIVLGFLVPGSAIAQQSQTDPSDQLAEVIVTASKRAEPLQKAPEAVSALSADVLQDMGATSFADYARTVPSLTFTDLGAGREKPALRGINATVGSDTVGYYIGETPVESVYLGSAINPNLIDLDHIEVCADRRALCRRRVHRRDHQVDSHGSQSVESGG
jgi:iron complex outermembrane receptor protein